MLNSGHLGVQFRALILVVQASVAESKWWGAMLANVQFPAVTDVSDVAA